MKGKRSKFGKIKSLLKSIIQKNYILKENFWGRKEKQTNNIGCIQSWKALQLTSIYKRGAK